MTSSISAPRSTRNRLAKVDPRLLEAVRDPSLRPLVASLTAHTLQALADTSRVDDSLYTRFMEGGGQVAESGAPLAVLNRLCTATFRGVRALLTVLARLSAGDLPAEPEVTGPAESDDDIEFDFGDGAPSSPNPLGGALELGDLDIDGALDGIADRGERDDSALWLEVREQISGVEYGLRSQIRELDERVATAMAGGHVAQALETIDDTRNAVGEGLFAILVAVYGVFLPTVDVSSVAPGYFSALGRALLVRRGVADLAHVVGKENTIVQSRSASDAKRAASLASVRKALETFIQTPGFKGMRAADRWSMVEFERALSAQSTIDAHRSCEGLSKFLESLGSINQREVLVTHDERALHELRETLSAARPLISVSLRTATEMVRQALTLAESLYGRSRANDELLSALRDASPALTSESEVEAVIETMELLLDDMPG